MFAFKGVASGEFRMLTEGVTKAGKPYGVVRIEQDSGYSEFSTSDPDILASCKVLAKGDFIACPVFAFASRDKQYALLTASPNVITASGVDY